MKIQISSNLAILFEEIVDCILDVEDYDFGFTGIYFTVNDQMILMLYDDLKDISNSTFVSDSTKVKIQNFLNDLIDRGILVEHQ